MSHKSSEVNPEAEVQFSEGRQEPYQIPLSPLTSGTGTKGDDSSHTAGAELTSNVSDKLTGEVIIQDSTSLLQERLITEVIRPLLQDVNNSHLLAENRLHAARGKIADIIASLDLGSSNYRPIGTNSSQATLLLPTATTAPAQATATGAVQAAAVQAAAAAAQTAAVAQTAAAQATAAATAAVQKLTAAAAEVAAAAAQATAAAAQVTAAVQKATAAADRASVVHAATAETTGGTRVRSAVTTAVMSPFKAAPAHIRTQPRCESNIANNTALADQFNKPKGTSYNWADEDPHGEFYEETIDSGQEGDGRNRDSQTVQILRESYGSGNKRSTTRRTYDKNLVTTHSRDGLTNHNTDNGRGYVGTPCTDNQISQPHGTKPCPICLQREKATRLHNITQCFYNTGGPWWWKLRQAKGSKKE